MEEQGMEGEVAYTSSAPAHQYRSPALVASEGPPGLSKAPDAHTNHTNDLHSSVLRAHHPTDGRSAAAEGTTSRLAAGICGGRGQGGGFGIATDDEQRMSRMEEVEGEAPRLGVLPGGASEFCAAFKGALDQAMPPLPRQKKRPNTTRTDSDLHGLNMLATAVEEEEEEGEEEYRRYHGQRKWRGKRGDVAAVAMGMGMTMADDSAYWQRRLVPLAVIAAPVMKKRSKMDLLKDPALAFTDPLLASAQSIRSEEEGEDGGSGSGSGGWLEGIRVKSRKRSRRQSRTKQAAKKQRSRRGGRHAIADSCDDDHVDEEEADQQLEASEGGEDEGEGEKGEKGGSIFDGDSADVTASISIRGHRATCAEMQELNHCPAEAMIRYQSGMQLTIGEAGREIVRKAVRLTGMSGHRICLLRNPELLRLAHKRGLWPMVCRLYQEHSNNGLPMSPLHQAIRSKMGARDRDKAGQAGQTKSKRDKTKNKPKSRRSSYLPLTSGGVGVDKASSNNQPPAEEDMEYAMAVLSWAGRVSVSRRGGSRHTLGHDESHPEHQEGEEEDDDIEEEEEEKDDSEEVCGDGPPGAPHQLQPTPLLSAEAQITAYQAQYHHSHHHPYNTEGIHYK
ncbi:unnamed protein product [Vitrella brassicaformis CCMP3155]|uniref:Uncharacterized protein n=3 Tax=Vitrella brassicaformis TaxID=1169539 RepID=A0A0G4GJY1_VITBC|nr:unnamed protein product [Vitrella brassicaformis CCMP3155]|eukprot:CEM30233.1 unnamed protein product [Vitrella brassicaformis CCMP3155]